MAIAERVPTVALSSGELSARWTAFFEETDLRRSILAIAEAYPKERALEVPFGDLERVDRTLADTYLERPDAAISAGEAAIREMLPATLALATPLRLRVHHLPAERRVPIHEIRKEHLGKALAIEGIVRRAAAPQPKVVEAVLECGACRQKIRWPQDQTSPTLRFPGECPPEQNGCGKPASRARFTFLEAESSTVDFQRLDVQEEPERLKGGTHPESLTVHLTEDLVEQMSPGTRVTVNGVLRAVPRPAAGRGPGATYSVLDVVLTANSLERRSQEYMEIEISEEDRREIERWRGDPQMVDRIVDSLAPSIKGMRMEKEAIALQLFGGVEKVMPDGVRVRGDIHCLLIGDPGLAKSQLLLYVSRTSPRGVYTSGKGTTSAGLTAAAIKDESTGGRWTLEAGAMVLADRGFLCLHPDSEVMVDGTPRAIGTLFDETRASAWTTRSGVTVQAAPLRTPTVSLNLHSLTTTTPTASLVVRRPFSGELLRLRLSSGLEIRLTPDHPLLDGEDLEWRPAQDVGVGDTLVTVQRLPSRRTTLWIFDLLPATWEVSLSRAERAELWASVSKRFPTKAEACRKYGLRREVFTGRDSVPLGKLRALLEDLGELERWRRRPLAFGPRVRTERLRVAHLTPDLAYVLGFLAGDGHVARSPRRTAMSIMQADVHRSYTDQVIRCTERVGYRRWGEHPYHSAPIVRGRRTESSGVQLTMGSQLLGELFDWATRDGLQNLLSLPDEALLGFLAGTFDADGCVSVRRLRGHVQPLVTWHLSKDRRTNRRLVMALRRFDIFATIRPSPGVLRIELTSRGEIARLMGLLAPFSAKARRVPPGKREMPCDHERTPTRLVRRLLQRSLVSATPLLKAGLWSRYHGARNGHGPIHKVALRKLAPYLSPHLSMRDRERLRGWIGSDYATDQVVSVEREPYQGPVFDLRVPDGASFLCDGVLVHNCLDEADKMSPEDRSALHEGLEQGQISIAKAGITATLSARCPVLAAANPKFGRFTADQQPQQQFDLPPTLLSRFDVILPLRDRPDPDSDRKLARAILTQHQEAEAHESEANRGMVREAVAPAGTFSQEFLKKYIAYARQNVRPVMDAEAYEKIESYYMDMRKVTPSEEEDRGRGGIAITPRQLEALVRLTEASARARLSAQATVLDAARAVRIIEHFLREVTSTEGGKRDIDLLFSGITAGHRDQIQRVRHVMEVLNDASAHGFSEETLLAATRAQGLPDDQVRKVLKELLNANEVYQPRQDLYRLAS